MHILFLSDNFPPEVNAPASRTHEHCRQWVAAGTQVTVITCAPNFPKGRVFDGYRNRLWQQETVDGFRVIRVWSYITANEGFAKRVLDYTSYMLTAFVASLFVRRIDVVVATSPQFFTAVAGWAVGLVRRVPFVFELRDIWPESIKAVGAMKESLAIRLLERVELFLYRRAARIVSVTESWRARRGPRGFDTAHRDDGTHGGDTSR
ncbi:MAG: glycosyltransferase, partial [Pseudomonadota bacterium]